MDRTDAGQLARHGGSVPLVPVGPGGAKADATELARDGAMAGTGQGAFARALELARTGHMSLVALLEATQLPEVQPQPDAVLALYQTWLAHTQSPQRHVALFNCGTVLAAVHRHVEAEAAYREALQFQPGFMQAHLNLGHQLEHQLRHEEALAEWRMVLALVAAQAQASAQAAAQSSGQSLVPVDKELSLHALNNLARLLEQLRRFDESERYMVQSLQLQADQPRVIQHYVHIRQKQCEWPVYKTFDEVTASRLVLGTSPLAMLGESDDPALQLLAARSFVQERVKPITQTLAAATRQKPGRIRIGYLSGDLCMHAVGLLTVELLELHDRERFEVFGYCWSREDGSPLRARILAALDQHVPIGKLDDLAAAQRIVADDIDILVDLQGLTSGARPVILSWRPARQQLTYLGFPGTTGLPSIDRVIADRYVMPEALLPYMTEQPLYLRQCFQVSDRQRVPAKVPTRAECGLPDEGFVYCSFNNNFKMGQGLFQVWMRVLQQVPGSVLWLLADNEWAKANMVAEAVAHGLDPVRLIFAPRVAPAEYLARFGAADLFLDTWPYNAGTTASDVLWMGTPLLTCSGRTFVSRMAGSLLHAVGLPDLVTDNLADYERLAVMLGRQPQRVASYRRYLAEHRKDSPLFDIPGLVKDLEQQLQALVAAQD
jgi:predicted O-linked N-acetylglucosamine transferase (SPINDLY family)